VGGWLLPAPNEPRQHAAYDRDAKLGAGLTDDLAQTFTHPAFGKLRFSGDRGSSLKQTGSKPVVLIR